MSSDPQSQTAYESSFDSPAPSPVFNNPADLGHDAFSGIASESEGDGARDGHAFYIRGLKFEDEVLFEPPLTKEENEIEERKTQMNHTFGFRPWPSSLHKRSLSDRSPAVQSLYAPVTRMRPVKPGRCVAVGNICWTVFFGWWVCLAYLMLALIMAITLVGLPYARLCVKLGWYYLWPFNKCLSKNSRSGELPVGINSAEDWSQATSGSSWGAVDYVRYILWIIFCVPVLIFVHAAAALGTFLLVVFIPMAKINQTAITHMFVKPLNLTVTVGGPEGRVVCCTTTATNMYFYKYAIWGMNVIMINMNIFCVIALVLGYASSAAWREANPIIVLAFCLLSVIPLSYAIGAAVASISAQTNFAIGAVLNATFGSIIEAILYVFTLIKGLNTMVQQALTGSILSMLLLLPGLSMIFGGFKYKEQYFNKKAQATSSTLLFIAIVGAYTPTIYSYLYSEWHYKCDLCQNGTNACTGCHYLYDNKLFTDPTFLHKTKYLMYACSIILPLAYFVGLLFTLKTHTYIYTQSEVKPGQKGAPDKKKSHKDKPATVAELTAENAHAAGLEQPLLPMDEASHRSPAASPPPPSATQQQTSPVPVGGEMIRRGASANLSGPELGFGESPQTRMEEFERLRNPQGTTYAPSHLRQEFTQPLDTAPEAVSRTPSPVKPTTPAAAELVPIQQPPAGPQPLVAATASQPEQPAAVRVGAAPKEGGNGHGKSEVVLPIWKCVVVLVAATTAFGLIAEALTGALEPALVSFGMPKSFAGLVIIGVVPNAALFVGAIQFALKDDITLSIEIGTSSAIQSTLIEMPLMVLISGLMNANAPAGTGVFTLVFPFFDVVAVMLCVLILNHVTQGPYVCLCVSVCVMLVCVMLCVLILNHVTQGPSGLVCLCVSVCVMLVCVMLCVLILNHVTQGPYALLYVMLVVRLCHVRPVLILNHLTQGPYALLYVMLVVRLCHVRPVLILNHVTQVHFTYTASLSTPNLFPPNFVTSAAVDIGNKMFNQVSFSASVRILNRAPIGPLMRDFVLLSVNLDQSSNASESELSAHELREIDQRSSSAHRKRATPSTSAKFKPPARSQRCREEPEPTPTPDISRLATLRSAKQAQTELAQTTPAQSRSSAAVLGQTDEACDGAPAPIALPKSAAAGGASSIGRSSSPLPRPPDRPGAHAPPLNYLSSEDPLPFGVLDSIDRALERHGLDPVASFPGAEQTKEHDTKVGQARQWLQKLCKQLGQADAEVTFEKSASCTMPGQWRYPGLIAEPGSSDGQILLGIRRCTAWPTAERPGTHTAQHAFSRAHVTLPYILPRKLFLVVPMSPVGFYSALGLFFRNGTPALVGHPIILHALYLDPQVQVLFETAFSLDKTSYLFGEETSTFWGVKFEIRAIWASDDEPCSLPLSPHSAAVAGGVSGWMFFSSKSSLSTFCCCGGRRVWVDVLQQQILVPAEKETIVLDNLANLAATLNFGPLRPEQGLLPHALLRQSANFPDGTEPPTGAASAPAATAAAAAACDSPFWQFVPSEGSQARSLYISQDGLWYAKLVTASVFYSAGSLLEGHVLSQWHLFGLPYRFLRIPNFGRTLWEAPPAEEELPRTARALVELVYELATSHKLCHNDFRSANLVWRTRTPSSITLRLIDFDRYAHWGFPLPPEVRSIRSCAEKPGRIACGAALALHQVVLTCIRFLSPPPPLPLDETDFLFEQESLRRVLPANLAEILVPLVPEGYEDIEPESAEVLLDRVLHPAAVPAPPVPPA
ncbi:putative cation/H+ exchanger protein 1 [Paratrimastix pyriformis]|uniref:Cation/H+ exchanger protein 1 n=1 Tax=Paratrimastix pyriformis TaxID=342808 RepID=A0ABQ8U7P9_9EUKA|nr:putative cation/H+ exchanger protein 1 [Paratrimastix pyriformis]